MWNGTVILGIFLKKLKTELPDDPAILLLGVYPREKKTYVLTKKKIPCAYSYS